MIRLCIPYFNCNLIKKPYYYYIYIYNSVCFLAQQQRAVLARSMAAYASKTCIRFVPKEAKDRDYITIQKLDG